MEENNKIQQFLHCCGAEAQHRYYLHSRKVETLNQVFEVMSVIYHDKRTLMSRRYEFQNLVQEENENVLDFSERLQNGQHFANLMF